MLVSLIRANHSRRNSMVKVKVKVIYIYNIYFSFYVSQVGVLSGSVICGTCQMDASAGSLSPGHTYCTWVYSNGGPSLCMLDKDSLQYDKQNIHG